jgi:nucleotide-binding universal stress UspA family protein
MMYKNILIPVLFDEGHDTQASFDMAQTLADKGAKFTVVHVLESMPSYMTAGIPSDLLRNNRRGAEASLNEAVKKLPGADAIIVEGHAGRTIVDVAVENDIDCIVIASHKLGFSDIFLGSTAAKVVRHAKCSVHVIR